MMPPRALRVLLRFAVVLVAVALASCSSRVAPPEPPSIIRRADDAFNREDYDAAIHEYRAYLDAVDQGIHTPRAFYKSALSSYRLGRYTESLATLAELAHRYPNGRWVQVEALRGDCQSQLGLKLPAVVSWDNAWGLGSNVDKPKLRNRLTPVAKDLQWPDLDEATHVVHEDEVREILQSELDSRGAAPLVASGAAANRAGQAANEPSPEAVVVAEPEPTPEPEPQVAAAETQPPPASGASQGQYFRPRDSEGSEEAPAVYAPPPRPQTAKVTAEPMGEAEAQPQPAQQAAARPASIDSMAKLDAGEDFSQEIKAPPAAVAPAPQAVDEGASLQPAEIEPEEALPETGPQVGCIVPLTGKDRDLGEHVLRGLRLVFGDASDRLVVKDSGSNATIAARLLTELAEDDDFVVAIAAVAPGEAKALALVANQKSFPLLLLSDDAAAAGDYVIPVRADLGQSKAEAVRALVEHSVNEQAIHQFAALNETSAESLEWVKLFRAEVAKRGAKVVASDSYQTTAPSLAASTLADWQGQGVQAIFVADDASKVAAFARSVQREAPTVVVLGVHGWGPVAGRSAGFNGMVFAGGQGTTSFVERYQTAYGVAPDSRDAQAYDAGAVAKALLRHEVGRADAMARLASLGWLEGAISDMSVSRQGIRRKLLLLRSSDGGSAAPSAQG